MLRIENIESIEEHWANVPCMARAYNPPPIRRLGIERIETLHACYAHAMHVADLVCISPLRKLFPIIMLLKVLNIRILNI